MIWRRPDPGAIAYAHLAKVSIDEAYDALAKCLGMKDKYTWGDGIIAYLKCIKRVDVDVNIPPDAPRETVEKALKVIRVYSEKRFRPIRIYSDEELLHIVFDAGCGMFVLTVSPDGAVTVSKEEDVVVKDVERGVVVCKPAPPKLKLEKYMEVM